MIEIEMAGEKRRIEKNRETKNKKQSSCLQLPERKIISYRSFILLNKMWCDQVTACKML